MKVGVEKIPARVSVRLSLRGAGQKLRTTHTDEGTGSTRTGKGTRHLNEIDELPLGIGIAFDVALERVGDGHTEESLAGHGAGVENGFAAAHGEFPCHAGSYLGTLRFSEPPRSWLDGRSASARAGSWRRLVDL